MPTRFRLSYANVISTLALFIAIGGGAYAAIRINGRQLVDRSVSEIKLQHGAVGTAELSRRAVVRQAGYAQSASYAAVAGNTQHLLVPHSRSRARPATARAASAATSLVTLQVGQSVTVLQSGPFTVTAKCIDQGSGAYTAELDATASVDGWFASGTANSANQSVNLAGVTNTAPYDGRWFGGSLRAPDGEMLVLAPSDLSVHQSSDCSVALYGVN